MLKYIERRARFNEEALTGAICFGLDNRCAYRLTPWNPAYENVWCI